MSAKAKKLKTIQIKLVKSPIGYSIKQKRTIRALGLRRINQIVTQVDTPVLRGMLSKVSHLVAVMEE